MKIYHRLSLFFLCLLLLGCDQFKTTKNNSTSTEVIDNSTETIALFDNQFLVNGIAFNAENKSVYLYKFEDSKHVVIDSTLVTDNTFKFKGTVETPAIHGISFNNTTSKFPFLIDNSSIDLFLNPRFEKSSSYSSSQIQKEYAYYTNKTNEFKDQGIQLYYNMKGDFSAKNIKELRKKRLDLFAKSGSFDETFIKENSNSHFSALIVKNRIKTHLYDKNIKLFNMLSDDIKTSDFGQVIKASLDKMERKPIPVKTEVATTKETVTKPEGEYRPKAYALSGKNQYGETMSLNSIPSGKVVLLDFWASWCGPCRASNPDLVALYNKYNAQGLEIMSISEDKGEAEWMTAIHVDNLTWDYHVLDKNKSIAFRYGVESIPFKLLIDKNGNIASGKISGRSLENRIKQLLAE